MGTLPAPDACSAHPDNSGLGAMLPGCTWLAQTRSRPPHQMHAARGCAGVGGTGGEWGCGPVSAPRGAVAIDTWCKLATKRLVREEKTACIALFCRGASRSTYPSRLPYSGVGSGSVRRVRCEFCVHVSVCVYSRQETAVLVTYSSRAVPNNFNFTDHRLINVVLRDSKSFRI